MMRFDILILLLLGYLCMPVGAKSDTRVEVAGLIYTILSETENTCSVSASAGLSGNITIPETVTLYGSEYHVVSIARDGFRNTEIDSVFLPSSMRRIERTAFVRSPLRFIDLNQVEEIESGAFSYSNLKTLTLNKTLTYLGSEAFKGCEDLKSVRIKANLWSLPEQLFADCTGLESIELPENLNYIRVGVFDNCTNLSSIGLPSTLKGVEAFAFRNCRSLKSVYFPDGMSEIGYGAFLSCSNLAEIQGGNSIVTIQHSAFSCSGLKTIFFPVLETVGDYAFNMCANLQEVYLPLSLSEIGENAFYMDDKLSSVYSFSQYPPILSENAFSEISPNAALYVPISAVERYASSSNWKNFPMISFFNVPIESLNIIEDCISIDLDLPMFLSFSVTPLNYTSEILWRSEDNEILQVDARGKIVGKSFGECRVFAEAEGLKDSALLSVVPGFDNLDFIPKGEDECSVKSKFHGALWEPVSLKNITLPKKVYLNNRSYNLTTLEVGGFTNCKIDTLLIKAELDEIAMQAFQLSVIDSISLPSSLKSLGLGAFSGATINSHLNIPNEVTFGESVFSAAYLKSVTFGEGMTELPRLVFHQASISSGKLTLPNSIKKIGRAALALYSIKEIVIGDELQEIDQPTGFAEDLERLVCMSHTPPILLNAVQGYHFPTLYVPGSSLTAYKQSTWDYYFADIRPIYLDLAEIVLNFDQLSLKPGDIATLKYELLPIDVNPDITVSWCSSDATVVTVDNNGKVVAVGVGDAEIIAQCGDIKAICQVSVTPISVEKITLNADVLSIEVGNQYQFEAYIIPANASYKELTWWSEDSNVATVNENGLVSVIGTGSTSIHVCSSVWSEVEASCILKSTSQLGVILDDDYLCNIYSIEGYLLMKEVSPQEINSLGKGTYIISKGSTKYKITK